jgi:hypothetical protein
MPKLPVNFKEILSHAPRNFEEQNKVLECSIIFINDCIIIMHAYYNYIINAEHNCYISDKRPPQGK